MEKQKKAVSMTFDEIVKQNERRIYYHLHKLNIRDPHHEFYQEGLVAMWNAYEKYQPDKGPLATYFNYTIRNRLIDVVRKEAREKEKIIAYKQYQGVKEKTGNYYKSGGNAYPIKYAEGPNLEAEELLQVAKAILSKNQWTWLKLFVIEDMTTKTIAEREGVSVDAVKSWGKEARKKLQKLYAYGEGI
ncbi:sigma-70 family RNA polymerase sigma factor [Virgibacillus sp. Bac330]|uniref:sigma-70 family RNA polymerase sigma factor n=1 Tax=Virgibacillus sp. Bac330 TaxID=2419841 RepID=UPI001F092E42|nr:sigma-70 family RNA polymerase sigma factor [Virgibacillus sp. Bac330]